MIVAQLSGLNEGVVVVDPVHIGHPAQSEGFRDGRTPPTQQALVEELGLPLP